MKYHDIKAAVDVMLQEHKSHGLSIEEAKEQVGKASVMMLNDQKLGFIDIRYVFRFLGFQFNGEFAKEMDEARKLVRESYGLDDDAFENEDAAKALYQAFCDGVIEEPELLDNGLWSIGFMLKEEFFGLSEEKMKQGLLMEKDDSFSDCYLMNKRQFEIFDNRVQQATVLHSVAEMVVESALDSIYEVVYDGIPKGGYDYDWLDFPFTYAYTGIMWDESFDGKIVRYLQGHPLYEEVCNDIEGYSSGVCPQVELPLGLAKLYYVKLYQTGKEDVETFLWRCFILGCFPRRKFLDNIKEEERRKIDVNDIEWVMFDRLIEATPDEGEEAFCPKRYWMNKSI